MWLPVWTDRSSKCSVCFFFFSHRFVFHFKYLLSHTLCFKDDVANIWTAICHPFLESCLKFEADVYLQSRIVNVNKYINGDSLQFSKCKKLLTYS